MTNQRRLPARPAIALLAIIGIGLGLRLFRLGSQSYWLDEAISLGIAQANLDTILTNAIQSSHPPLYYLVLKVWLALGVGVGEAAARLPSALLSTAAIPAVYFMARTLFPQNRRLGLLAAALMAVAPFVVVYAQEARMYALQLLLVPLMLSAFFRAWREGEPQWWALYAVTATLGAYTQYFTLLAVGGLHLLALLDRKRWRMRWRGLLLADLAIALLFAPQAAVFLGQTGIALDSDWVAADPIYLIRALHTLILSYSLPTWAVAVGFFVTLSLAALATYQIILALRRSRESATQQALWLVLLTFWPPLLLVALTVVVRPFYMPYRSLTVVIPSYVILLAYGLSYARRRSPMPILYGILAVLIALSLGYYYFDSRYAKPPYRDAAALIAERARPDDIELHTSDGSYLPFLHYEQPMEVYLLTGDPDARKPEPIYALMGGQTMGLQEALTQDRRIWLVVALEHSWEYQQDTLDRFVAQRTVGEEHSVGGIDVYLLEKRKP